MNSIFSFILDIDYKLFNLINQSSATALQDQFFPFITDLHQNIYFKWSVLLFVAVLFLRKFQRLGLTLFLLLFLAVGFSDFMGAKVKNHYLRLRPFENSEITAVQKSPAGNKSFYSNHASNMFTFATYTSAFFPAAAVPLYTVASIVGYSRIYNGVHYPTDVFAGAFMGILWGLLFSSLAKRMQRKLGNANS